MQPDAPDWAGGSYTRSGSSCVNINLGWGPDDDWVDNPGYGPSSYTRYVNGSSQGTQSANYPNNVTWNSGYDLSSGQTISFDFVANFSGGIQSLPLEKSWLCSNGSMIEQ